MHRSFPRPPAKMAHATLLGGLLTMLAALPCSAAATPIPVVDESAQPGAPTSHAQAPAPWVLAWGGDWMSSLPDDMPLGDISMPGTHDSGARHGGIAVATQTWSIGDQLRSGIRYLDIRLRRSGRDFAIHHGAFYQHLTFQGVMEAVGAFLREHPGETVLMRVKEEYVPAADSEPFAKIWGRYMADYGSLAYTSDSDAVPTLGQTRGKVVFLRNQGEIPSRYGVAYVQQRIQDVYNVFAFLHHMHSGDNASLPSKKELVKEHIREAMRHGDGGGLVLNHLSGSGGMAPQDVARSVNGEIYGFLAGTTPGSRLGVLIMDFPGERLLYRIVKSNFRFEGSCPARSWRVQSDHSWAEFRLPDGAPVGQVIEIPGGAYNKYRFPKCNRVHWSDLSFLCTGERSWERTRGDWDADGACHGSKGVSPYVATGER